MQRKVIKWILILLMIAILCCIIVILVDVYSKPMYEIRLYDDNWNELVKNKSGKGYKWDYYEFEYDGQPKGFNAIVFEKGKELYKFNYKTDASTYRNDEILSIIEGYTVIDEINRSFPTEKGEYVLIYKIDNSIIDIPKKELAKQTNIEEIRFKIV